MEVPMSNWFSKLFSGSVGSVVESVGSLADKFIQTDDEKAAFRIQVEQLLQQRDSEIEQTIRAELQAKERVLVAELQQGDTYTKRARPTVVYAGLGFIFLNYVLFPLVARFISDVDSSPLAELPTDFWFAWGGICSSWVIGRSMEKRGVRNPVLSTITGTKPPSKLLD